MAHEIRIPRLGWSMEEGTFAGWKKQDGDSVRAGDALFELEGEKALQDIESIDEGILWIPPDAPPPGKVVAVGRVIGWLLAPGERAPWDEPRGNTAAASAAGAPGSAAPVQLPPAAAPSVRRLARELGVSLNQLAGTGPSGRVTADDIRDALKRRPPVAAGESSRRKLATPRARRAARQRGVDLAPLSGSGRGGRVRERDVVAAADASARPDENVALDAERIVTLTSLRRTIAAHLRRSHAETVPVTLHSRADASNLVSLRAQFQTPGGSSERMAFVPSYTDLILKLSSAVLQQHPRFAAVWQKDQLVLPASFDIGLAVDTDEGLVVPVVRDVPALRLSELAARTKDLVERARARRLQAAELQGGVFPVTSLGSFGIEAFTPVIHWPETAILGVGAIRREPVVVVEDRVEPRWQVTLSLTFDHCAADGAPAARFLQMIRTAIENPAAWLLG